MIDFTAAVAVANRWKQQTFPLWAYIVGPSGTGKTTILEAFGTSPEFILMDSLTPNSFISGYRDEEDPSKDPSLLPQIAGKTLILLDFSTILNLRSETQAQIFADLRRLYDSGEMTKHKGNIGIVSHSARFGLIAAVTRDIERLSSEMAPLGERFISYELTLGDRDRFQRQGSLWLEQKYVIRDKFRKAANEFLTAVPQVPPQEIAIPRELLYLLFKIADVTTVWRTYVPRQRIGGNYSPCYIPQPESPGRFSGQLQLLIKGYALTQGRRAVEREDLRLAAETATYCLPTWRRSLLGLFRKHKVLTSRQIQEALDVHQPIADRQLDNMVLLKAIQRLGNGQYGLCRDHARILEEVGDLWTI